MRVFHREPIDCLLSGHAFIAHREAVSCRAGQCVHQSVHKPIWHAQSVFLHFCGYGKQSRGPGELTSPVHPVSCLSKR